MLTGESCNVDLYSGLNLVDFACKRHPPNRTYQASAGQSECLSCEAGKSQALRGQPSCDTCETGTWSHVGSTTCDTCDSGYFLHPEDGCAECEGDYKGADCSRKGSTLEGLVLATGWWRTTSSSDSLVECAFENACVGGNRTDEYCAESYSSYLCSV